MLVYTYTNYETEYIFILKTFYKIWSFYDLLKNYSLICCGGISLSATTGTIRGEARHVYHKPFGSSNL